MPAASTGRWSSTRRTGWRSPSRGSPGSRLLPNAWRFGPVGEADFEPLLAIRIDVMREHLERVFRFKPSRARRIFREHFAEPGMRLILVGEELAGCVAFRQRPDEIRIDSFYLARRHHNSGLGTAILKVLLAEADATGLPVRLEVLRGSPAGRFYERHGFAKIGEDDIETHYERAAITPTRPPLPLGGEAG